MGGIGRIKIIFGIALVIVGLVITLLGRVPFFGNLPGDFNIEKDNYRIYLPIVTSIVLSLLLTVILNVIIWLINR